MKMTIKILNLLALMGAVAWLTNDPDWEPLVTVIGLIASYLGLEITDHRKISNHDKEVFEKLLAELPPDGRGMNFLKHQDIGASFESNSLNELDNFIHHWDDAMHEFHNKKMEEKRKELYQKITCFQNKLCLNVFASNQRGCLTMDLEDMKMDRDKLNTRDELNDMATEVYEIYQELVRIGRKLY